jgi:hypothetical protein
MASLVDLLPRGEPRPADPGSKRLALAIIRQALSDARSSRHVSIPALEAWAVVAGLTPQKVADVFQRLRSRDPVMLAAVADLRTIRKAGEANR